MSNTLNDTSEVDAKIILIISLAILAACALYKLFIRPCLLSSRQTPVHAHDADFERNGGDGIMFPLQRPTRALVRRGSPSSNISHPAPRYERHVEDGVVANPEQVKLEQRGNHVFAFEVKGEEPPPYQGSGREE
jgi:hypothetical protein